MRKIGFELKNYKLIDELNVPLSDVNIILVKGDNKGGKTGLINGIFENLTAKNLSDEPLKQGTTSGEKSVIITDKYGKEIKIVHTFEKKSPRGSFYAIQDGKKISSVEKIRELIGECNKYTIYDFFVMCRTTEGRRKFVSEILMKMLSKEQSERIEEINKNINPRNGVIYLQRRDKNTSLDALKNTPMLSKEEEAILLKEAEWTKLVNEVKESINKLTKGDDLLRRINAYIYALNENGISQTISPEEITFKNDDIKNLFLNAIDMETKILSYKNAFISQKDIINEKIEAIENNADYKIALEGLLSVEKIKYKKESYAEINKQITSLEKEIEGINAKMNTLLDEKNTILSNSNLPEGLVIESDSEFTYNGFNFSETEISESEAQLLLAKLTIPIYDGPYFRMGNADIYGKKALKELNELANKYGKVLAMEKVDDNTDDVYVECLVYDELENLQKVKTEVKKEEKPKIEPKEDIKEESTGNKLLREAKEKKAKSDKFIDDAKKRGVDMNVDFSKEVSEYESGNPIPDEKEITDDNIKKLNDLF
jgi:hypothetical protein